VANRYRWCARLLPVGSAAVEGVKGRSALVRPRVPGSVAGTTAESVSLTQGCESSAEEDARPACFAEE